MKNITKVTEEMAREYCKRENVDPDTMISHSPEPNDDGTIPMALLYSARWKLVQEELQCRFILFDFYMEFRNDKTD